MSEQNVTDIQKSDSDTELIEKLKSHDAFKIAIAIIVPVISSGIIYVFLDQSIQSTRSLIEENGERIGRVEARIQQTLAKQSRSIDRIRDDVDAVRLFLATSDKDGAELSLDPAIREYPYDRLGMGGPGQEPVPDFFTYSIGLPFSEKPERIEAEKIELSAVLRRALIADNRFEYDDSKHEIEVYETYHFPEESDNPRLELVAVAVFKATVPG